MDKKISSFQIVLLATFAAIGLGAVLIFALAVGGGSGNSVGPVIIWGTFDQTAMSTLLRKESDTNTSLSSVSYVHKDPTTYESDLSEALASGAGPDIYILASDEAYADAGKTLATPYASLSQAQFQNIFVGAGNVYLGSDGVLGVPLLVDPLVLYWNRDTLASAGIAQPPQYWDQIPQMVGQLTQRADDGTLQKSAIALGTYQNIDAAKDILALLIMQAGGAITASDPNGNPIAALTQGSAGSGPAQSALSFYTEFANPSGGNYTWSQALPNARQAFGSGQLAMYIGYASEEPLIRATNPNLNFAIAPILQVRSGVGSTQKNSIDTGKVYALAITKNSKNSLGARAAASLLASSAVIGADFSTALGMPSARRDILSGQAQGDQLILNNMALITRTWVDPDPVQTDQIFQDMIENTESGASTVSDAIQRANQQIGQLFKSPQNN